MNQTFTDLVPAGWTIFIYVSEQKKPDSCMSVSCLCICKQCYGCLDRQIRECDKDGVCYGIENLMEGEKIELNSAKILRV
jgi:hypothetical protein